MDNLSRIDIELPQQLNINDTQINDNFNEIVYKDVSNEECDREVKYIYYKKKITFMISYLYKFCIAHCSL